MYPGGGGGHSGGDTVTNGWVVGDEGTFTLVPKNNKVFACEMGMSQRGCGVRGLILISNNCRMAIVIVCDLVTIDYHCRHCAFLTHFLTWTLHHVRCNVSNIE